MMDEADSCTLAELVEFYAPRRLTMSLSLEIVSRCLGSLHNFYYHHPHVIPKDLSPTTILVTVRGEVCFADFDPSEVAKRHENAFVDYGYLAPELLDGDYDERSDVFRLGIISWELLSGRRLFRAETDYETLALTIGARVPSILESHPEADPALDQIVSKALRRQRDLRYETVMEFQRMINEYVSYHGMSISREQLGSRVSECISSRIR